MPYEEFESRHLRVAHYDPRTPLPKLDLESAREAAEMFGELVIERGLRDGADVATIEAWATTAGKYGRQYWAARERVDAFIQACAKDEVDAWLALNGDQP